MNYAFNVGDTATYHGPPLGGILAPADVVEIVRQAGDPSYYVVKIFGSFAAYTFMVQANYLKSHVHGNVSQYTGDYDISGLDSQLPLGYSNSTSEETKQKRKEAGECETCGRKRDVSIHGLLPCSSCEQPLPARW